jgi:hypothetical protein
MKMQRYDSPINPEWERFSNGIVTAEAEVDDESGTIGIVNFYSTRPRQGYGRRFLLDLRQQFSHIHAYGVMEDSPVAIAFWQQMLTEGIIESANLSNGKSLSSHFLAEV